MPRTTRSRREADPIRITTAPTSAAADRAHRQRRYLISMTLRTVCFLGAVVVGPGWLRWVLMAGAVLLPTIAVILANRIAPRSEGAQLTDFEYRREL